MKKAFKKVKGGNIDDEYRRILEIPSLGNQEIDRMREHVTLLAQAVCEHVWRKKFY